MKAFRVLPVSMVCILACAACGQTPSKRNDLPKPHRAAEEASAEKGVAAETALCPVTGKPIDRQFFTEFRGKRVYFADAAARDKFTQDPYEFADGVQKQWEVLRPLRVQVRCPVTGQPVDTKLASTQGEQTIYFATPEAKVAYDKEPPRYAAQLEECYTFQTLCPCGHGEIRPDVSAPYKGKTVYFCCPGCRASLESKLDEVAEAMETRTAANQRKWQIQQAGVGRVSAPPAASRPAEPGP